MTQNVLQELFHRKQQYLNHFFEKLDLAATETVLDAFSRCSGAIFFTGIGKSGLIAKKIAFTMTSTGTRALYLSPTNALHGDIGIVTDQDLFVLLSKSGESDELLTLVPYLRNKGARLISIVSTPSSRLEKACHLSVTLPMEKELCPFDLAPTTSSTIQSIFGDVLAVALMQLKNFSLDQFAKNHPAGRIGKRITLKVEDLMITGEAVPKCRAEDTLVNVLVELSNKRCGCVLIVDKEDALHGIFTDGDLRRALQKHGALVLETPMEKLMNTSPKWIVPNVLAWDAMKMMEADQQHPFTVLPVLVEGKRVGGLIKMHDIVQSGL